MDDNVKDYNVTIRVKNNKLLKAMRQAGYSTVADFSRACGIPPGTIGLYLNLKRAAMRYGKQGNAKIDAEAEFRPTAIKMAEHLNVSPFDLFPFKFLEGHLEKNTVEREYAEEEVQYLMDNSEDNPEQLLLSQDRDAILSKTLRTLTPREERIIRSRFGLGGVGESTLDDLAKEFGVTKERIRQMESKALRKLKHPKRSQELRNHL